MNKPTYQISFANDSHVNLLMFHANDVLFQGKRIRERLRVGMTGVVVDNGKRAREREFTVVCHFQ